MSRFVRSVSRLDRRARARCAPAKPQSKYRHVYGEKSKVTYENAKISGSAWDTNLVTAGGKYIAVNWQVSGGGVSDRFNLLQRLARTA